MKKTIKVALIAYLILMVCLSVLTACNKDAPTDDTPHVHIEVIDSAVAPTCTEKGLTEGKHCSVCNEVLVAQKEISINHVEGNWIVDQEATKNVNGIRHTVCTMCGAKIREEIISATGSIGLEYIVNSDNKSCTIIGRGDCDDSYIMIPRAIGAYTVVSIGDRAFYNDDNLMSVEIGSSVTNICDSAFNNCSNLARVIIPDSVTSISNNAFYGCNKLQSVYITDIAKWCKISFSTSSSNPLCYAGNLYLRDELVTELVVTNGTKNINSYAFYNCSSLTDVIIPDSVTSIGELAFYNCSSLESVTVGSGVTTIGNDAFYGCNKLQIVYITDIAKWCNISFSTSTSNPLCHAGFLCIRDKLVTELVVTNGTKNINSYAFYNCSSLRSVFIPDSVVSIGNDAFRDCTRLTSVIIPDSVATIGNNAFYDCTSLTSVVFESGSQLANIGNFAFFNCSSLTRIIIPESVTSIGEWAFSGCYSLTSVAFENANGWWYDSSSSATSGTSISATVLSDSVTAAKYLTLFYGNYYWHRT